ncbi:MAG: DNA-directed RNA polymerase subunit H [archaeon]|nr:DNA-directed RNA polymerase subunit H [archaeon]
MGLERVDEHFLVPKHEIVQEEKVEELLKKFGSTINQFPQILKDDPAIEEIGGKKGDVIKITRKSSTAGISIFYRVVA